jgi:alpha/beta superfamily hydrolase
MGFSFGGGVALLLASLLESGRKRIFDEVEGRGPIGFPRSFDASGDVTRQGEGSIQPPFKFAISFSGLATENPQYRAFYSPKIQTPTLHFIAMWDTVVEEKQSLALVNACERVERVIYHQGAHFVPSQWSCLREAVSFIKRCSSENISHLESARRAS